LAKKDWLDVAPAIAGGLNDYAGKLNALKDFGDWNDDESEEANVSRINMLNDDFLRVDTAIRSAFNRWINLPHPKLGVRHDSRQYSVLQMGFRSMLTCVSYEFVAYVLARLGSDEKEQALGEGAFGKGAALYGLVAPTVARTMAGEVDDIDAVMQWTVNVGDALQPIQEFDSEYTRLAAKLRGRAGLR